MAEVNLPANIAKRSRSADSRLSVGQSSASNVDGDIGESKENTKLPAFLNQSYTDLRKKFDELEWLQRGRLSIATLVRDPTHKWALESSPEVRARSRYMNVQAWANSRIHLKVPEGECDFVNASPIVLKDSETEEEFHYIATQGPRDSQLADFWNMVFHETGDIAVIVMLTQTSEGGREKCAQYYPTDIESPTVEFYSTSSDPFVDHDDTTQQESYSSGTVTLIESSYDETLRSNISKLELRVGSETKTVWHFLFAGWSDFSKPEGANKDALLELTKFTAEKAASPTNPRIVHCSAGVGRTGTFITLDHLMRELKAGKLLTPADQTTDALFDTVNLLREQRMMMVYNDIQYLFIHDALKEQAEMLLGEYKPPNESRPQKIAKPSVKSSKPELVPILSDAASTPPKSGSGTPEASD